MRLVLIAALLIALLTFSAKAQGPVAVTFSGGGPHTTCSTPVAGAYFLCQATDGTWVSNNGAAYFQVVQSGTSGVTSVAINGVTKTGAASFQLSAAPGITAQ